jgi:alkylation response protein AidB-like acyl-CoA dehydrogenase
VSHSDQPKLALFREEVRNFIAANLPQDIQRTVRESRLVSHEQGVRWQRILHKQGWVAPSWPLEWGGVEWSPTERAIFDEECALGACPPVNPMGLGMLGPLLIAHGSEEQKKRYLPKILSSEETWCQGYSEPGSGSDLASLQTKAVRDGDDYIVNGTKIWTSGAQSADFIFCLVRSNSKVKQQLGISLLLIDLTTPGVSVRPIIGLNEMHFFNQVFFDDVRVPAENLVGQENSGWTLAKAILGSERLHLSRTGENRALLDDLITIAKKEESDGKRLIDEDWFRRKIGRAEVRLKALDYTKQRFLQMAEAGQAIGPEISMLKLQGSELIQCFDELLLEAVGHYGLPYDASWMLGPREGEGMVPTYAGTISANRFRHKGYTIAGGSSEVQHTIIAKNVLGL